MPYAAYTHPPWVVELEAFGSNRLVCLPAHEARQPAVALHHWSRKYIAWHEVIVSQSYFAA
jgi:hypothetical protein